MGGFSRKMVIDCDFSWDFIVIQWDIHGIYHLVNIQKAIEHGPVEIVHLPINSMVIFHM